jgi:hypothetical protein
VQFPLWIVLPVTLLIFCALHWVCLKYQYERGLRSLRASSQYCEKSKQLREAKLAEIDRTKTSVVKRTKKCVLDLVLLSLTGLAAVVRCMYVCRLLHIGRVRMDIDNSRSYLGPRQILQGIKR